MKKTLFAVVAICFYFAFQGAIADEMTLTDEQMEQVTAGSLEFDFEFVDDSTNENLAEALGLAIGGSFALTVVDATTTNFSSSASAVSASANSESMD